MQYFFRKYLLIGFILFKTIRKTIAYEVENNHVPLKVKNSELV